MPDKDLDKKTEPRTVHFFIISAGHGLRDPGAVSGDIIEHLHAYQIAWHLRAELEELGHQCIFISCFQDLPGKIRDVNARHKVKPVHLAIEIHFNSSENTSANGTEVLYVNKSWHDVAAKISETISDNMDFKDRGAVQRTNLGWLNQTIPPALIVEVCFITNDRDLGVMLDDIMFHKTVASAIAEAVG